MTSDAVKKRPVSFGLSMICCLFTIGEGKAVFTETVCQAWIVTDHLENQEVRLEQHVHWMNPALRDLLFIYPHRAEHAHTHWHRICGYSTDL